VPLDAARQSLGRDVLQSEPGAVVRPSALSPPGFDPLFELGCACGAFSFRHEVAPSARQERFNDFIVRPETLLFRMQPSCRYAAGTGINISCWYDPGAMSTESEVELPAQPSSIIVIGVVVLVLALTTAALENSRQTARVPSPTPVAISSSTLAPLPSRTSTLTFTTTVRPTFTETLSPTETLTLEPTETALPLPTPTPTGVTMPTPDDEARLRKISAPILMYHHVGLIPTDADPIRIGLTIEPNIFQEHLQYLSDLGYESVSLYQLQNALAIGEALPPRPIIFTFDDGYIDNFEYAYPIMKEFGYSGTIFVATQFMDDENPEYLTWEMAREMSAAGWSIEPHSKRHLDLSDRPRDFLIFEILGSLETVAYHIGYQPRYFAYPAGKYDDRVIEVLQEAGFWGALTVEPGKNHRLANAFTWRRIRANGNETIIELALRLGEPIPTATTEAPPAPTETFQFEADSLKPGDKFRLSGEQE